MKKTFIKVLSVVFALTLVATAIVVPSTAAPRTNYCEYSVRVEQASLVVMPKKPAIDVVKAIVKVDTDKNLQQMLYTLAYDTTVIKPFRAQGLMDPNGINTVLNHVQVARRLNYNLKVNKSGVPAAPIELIDDAVTVAGTWLGDAADGHNYNENEVPLENDNWTNDAPKYIGPLAMAGPEQGGWSATTEMSVLSFGTENGAYSTLVNEANATENIAVENTGIVQVYFNIPSAQQPNIRNIQPGAQDIVELYFQLQPGKSINDVKLYSSRVFAYVENSGLPYTNKCSTELQSSFATLGGTLSATNYIPAPVVASPLVKIMDQVRFQMTTSGEYANAIDVRTMAMVSAKNAAAMGITSENDIKTKVELAGFLYSATEFTGKDIDALKTLIRTNVNGTNEVIIDSVGVIKPVNYIQHNAGTSDMLFTCVVTGVKQNQINNQKLYSVAYLKTSDGNWYFYDTVENSTFAQLYKDNFKNQFGAGAEIPAI